MLKNILLVILNINRNKLIKLESSNLNNNNVNKKVKKLLRTKSLKNYQSLKPKTS